MRRGYLSALDVGCLTQFVILPLDMVVTRMQTRPLHRDSAHSTAQQLATIVTEIREEGGILNFWYAPTTHTTRIPACPLASECSVSWLTGLPSSLVSSSV